MSTSGSIEEHPEYKIIVKANSLTVDIDNEIMLVHKVQSFIFRMLQWMLLHARIYQELHAMDLLFDSPLHLLMA
jgi:hypothetical protein